MSKRKSENLAFSSQYVKNITPNNFHAYPDGTKQSVIHFSTIPKMPKLKREKQVYILLHEKNVVKNVVSVFYKQPFAIYQALLKYQECEDLKTIDCKDEIFQEFISSGKIPDEMTQQLELYQLIYEFNKSFEVQAAVIR